MEIPGYPRLSADPAVCGGKPCIKDTRMRVVDILGALAAGDSADEIVADFPYVSHEDIKACLAYGAELSSHPFAIAAE